MTPDFVHLHVHTYYSILDGQSSIKKLVDKAAADGMKGMAVTDHGDMFGIKDLFDYTADLNKKRKKDGLEPFKPIAGCEMYVARRRKEDKVKEMGDNGGYHLVVLAKNYRGYKNLIKLVSRAWVDGYYYRPRTDRADLERYHEGLIVCSACLAGEVPRKILNDDLTGAREAVEWYKRVFGDDYYLELQRHQVTDPDLRANREVFPLQQRANRILMELAREYGVKMVCTNDCHFVDQENAEAHDHLLCLSTQQDLDDPKRMIYSKQEWFKTRQEMAGVFADVPEALANTMEVLDKVELYSIDHDPIMPFFPIPADFGTEEEWRRRFTPEQIVEEFTTDEHGANPLPPEEGEKKVKHLGGVERLYRIKLEADYLAKLTREGAVQRYGSPLTKEVSERILFELHIMKTMGFPGYFLIVQDFINAARNELGVMVGPGRGSAAGSVVAYCLGITKIDPLKYDLLFERFLNPDRISLPDIDTDFDDDGRGKVLKWVEDKYGHDNCAHIITYSTMATKNSIKDVARIEKVPLDVSNALCKAIPDRLPEGMKMNLPNAIKCTPELQEAEKSTDERMRNTIKYAKMLEGTVRGTGIHACGFIICRDPISDWVPVSTADDPDFKDTKTNCTQYDGHVIESTGLIKMDFLGLKTLSELKEAVANVKFTRGIDIDLDNIPIDDEKTYKLYQEGRTIGTFQFESPGMQKYLRELKPTVFEDLIAMNALYRPGPMDYIPSFIARKSGREPITYDIPCTEKYLKDTYGITVYQEQVMLLSRQLADFTRGESDALRKAMGKKKKAIVDQMKPKFLEGGKKNGHDPAMLEKIWGDWEKFASYAFNKSHAACYSWVAFQTAYMKANYPSEFMAAIMSRRKDDIKEITKLMAECRSAGIETLGPDVNESNMKFTVNHDGNIRFGLGAVKGVGTSAVENIMAARERGGDFTSVFDFVQRVNLLSCNKKTLESLADSGAFDTFGLKREQYFAKNAKGESFIETLIRYGNRYQEDRASSQHSLFGDENPIEIATPPVPDAEPWGDLERLNREREMIGIYLSAHPLDEYAVLLNHVCNTRMREIEDTNTLTERGELIFGGMVTRVKRGMSKKTGTPYGIIKIEDYSGSGELPFFGELWAKYQGYVQEKNLVLVHAKMEPRKWQSGSMELKVSSVSLMSEVKDTLINKITINIPLHILTEELVDSLTAAIKDDQAGGQAELFVHIVDMESQMAAEMVSRGIKVKANKRLMAFLEENADLKYSIN